MNSWTVFGRSGNRPERDKRRNLRHTNDLLNLGTRLTAQAEAGGRRQSREQARLYRDGFMIACLAHRPLQLAKFIGLELGRHLQHRGDGWWLEIAAAEPKPHTPISLPFPELLVPTLEAYLAYWRPRLAPANQAASCPALWLTEQGRGISASHASRQITRHTAAAFGLPVSRTGSATPLPRLWQSPRLRRSGW